MKNRAFLIAMVNAEIRAKTEIVRFTKEFESNGNQNNKQQRPATGQANAPTGNVPQQPVYRA